MFLPQLLHAFLPFIPSIIVLFFFPTAVQSQFRFDNLLEGIGMEAAQKIINGDLGQQNDPLRNVFGIWGRLLNRMAQKTPPSDDELHLKGAQEGDQQGEGNVIGEDPEGLSFFPRGGGFGGGSAKSFGGGSAKPMRKGDKAPPIGPNKIIDEKRLNELLPRLNPNFAIEEKHSSSQTTTIIITQPTTTTTEPKTTERTTTTTTKAMTEDQQKTTKKYKRKKKGGRKEEGEQHIGTKTMNNNTSTMANSSTEPSNTSPPMPTTKNLAMNENDWPKKAEQNQTTKVGATIQLRTSADEKRKGQMEIIKEGELAGLNETVLERAENETAQLIAEIENVLADAEMGPNGHWLRLQTEDRNMSTTRSWSSTMEVTDNKMEDETTTIATRNNKKEEESYEEKEGADEGEEGEESYEADEEEENGAVQLQNNSTMEKTTVTAKSTTNDVNGNITEETQRVTTPTTAGSSTTTNTETIGSAAADVTPKWNGTKKGIPEAEEEDQHQQQIAAQLQLDSAVTVSSPPSPSPQNIFNLNANSNAYANPNFTNVMKPVNSIIDGIGPLILPLIGYSQRAFDAYAPLVAQRSEGLPIFRPPAMAAASLSQQQQQIRPLVPIGTPPFSPPNAQQSEALFPSQQSAHFPHAISPSPNPSVTASPPVLAQEIGKEAPSLEILGRIIEERRKNEQKQRQNGKEEGKEISGSSPPDAELAYFPPNLPTNGPAQPFEEPIPERPTPIEQQQKPDRGYDVGRQTVHETFHEDSGLMLGTQQTQNEQQTHGPMALPTATDEAAAFGSGKRPNGPFGFIRR